MNRRQSKLLSDFETTQRGVDELNKGLKEKTAAAEKGLKVQENLLSKVQSLDTEIMKNEDLLNQYKNEKQLLMTKKELMNRKSEVEKGRKLHDQLHQQIDLYSLERSKTGQELEELEKENKKVLAKLRESEEKIDKLQANLRERSKNSSEGMELHGMLLHLIQAKESELLHQSRVVPDPHDDFLDIPLENIRGNLGKVMKDEVQNHAKPNSKNKKIRNSDDETQDMNVDNDPKKQEMLPPTCEKES
ncbi:hypothetical protein RND71_001521 [Anisodus tanguticus]|uniref:Uncharacterized protein n=1 Tax=Anisodus tanguticus TaxID=243964 RepID=A0AAE1VY61_9SOLA|nr:hypothetical protein RND71_001521 [Anisodus tanguticus]